MDKYWISDIRDFWNSGNFRDFEIAVSTIRESRTNCDSRFANQGISAICDFPGFLLSRGCRTTSSCRVHGTKSDQLHNPISRGRWWLMGYFNPPFHHFFGWDSYAWIAQFFFMNSRSMRFWIDSPENRDFNAENARISWKFRDGPHSIHTFRSHPWC